jgi:glycosyltransferase involved in cell wall biosynthesis
MSQPLVSIVTPFHNTAEYLAECIESVLAQDYSNFEYILLDNQSSDQSYAIAERYARTDPRIRLLRTERLLPQVPNYNFALRQIATESKYCKVVQADDWIFPRCVSEMVALAEENPAVAVVGSYELRETKVWGEGLHPKRRVVPGREVCRLYLLRGIHLCGTPTTVLYRGDLVRGRQPFYEEGRLHEDTEVVFELLREHDFGFVPQVLSFTRQQENSITGGNRDFLPQMLDGLILMRRYGEHFLSREEYARCMDDRFSSYYRALARRWLIKLGRGDQAFWDHQRRGLATIGEVLRPELIARSALPALLETALNPTALGRALQKVRRSGRLGIFARFSENMDDSG